ncbi:LysR family transcriptional regulator [Endozoicomonas sp.]|uniref:LysR family transcriptional regulator n=1 Tax=Endozoicomonas sp. TaxID=1892382 RepID=UPI00383B51F7
MYHWEGITEFVTVAETSSFTAAGKRLGISTAQVSRQINQLETRLNTRLLYRTTRKVSLTEEGSIFYSHCRQVLNNLEDAERAISNRQENPQGTIRMTAPVSYGEQHVMPAVLDYMEKYPEIEVICNLSNQTLDLVQEGYDLAIRLGHLPSSSMMARQLSIRTQYVCASGDYIRRNGAPHSLSELAQHNCLVGNSPYWRFMEDRKQRTIKVSGNLVCGSGYTLMDAAIRGMGLTQLPGYYVDEAIQSGKLTVLLQSFREPKEGIWAMYPHNRQLSPKIRLLVDWLAESLSKRSL